MYPLYAINTISFEELLEKDGNSRTYIKNNLEKYYYFLTYILHKRRYTTLKDGWVKVSVQKLKDLFKQTNSNGNKCWVIDRIRKDFKRWGIIKSKYVNTLLNTRSSRAKITDETLALGYSQWNTTLQLKPMALPKPPTLTGVYADIQRSLSLVAIDANAAYAFTNKAFATGLKLPAKLEGWHMNNYRYVNQDVFDSWKYSIDKIVYGNYYVHVQFATSGRVYTAITSFPKQLKHLLTINGKSNLVQLDCSCSQPLLFAAHLLTHYTELTADMKLYIQLVQDGKFYQHIQQLLTDNNLPFSPTGFKGEFFAKIFYSREKQFGKWRALFHTHFPGVSNAILKVKKVTLGAKKINKDGKTVVAGGDPSLLSNQLSLLESDIMIHGVAKSLYAAGIFEFLTIHDAILVPEEHADTVYNLMLEEYQNKGVTPTIKITNV